MKLNSIKLHNGDSMMTFAWLSTSRVWWVDHALAPLSSSAAAERSNEITQLPNHDFWTSCCRCCHSSRTMTKHARTRMT